MAFVDRVFFWLVRITWTARDYVAYRSHPHIGARSSFAAVGPGVVVERVECWCGCRCSVLIRSSTPLPVELPRSADWQLPPVEGWPAPIS